MADARALLQASRASRRIIHPYARYTDAGKLHCSLCSIAVKSESNWNSHLKTPEHAKRALRAAEALKSQSSKKRKADSEDEGEEDEARKRVRGTEDSEEGADQARQQVPRIEVSEEPDTVEGKHSWQTNGVEMRTDTVEGPARETAQGIEDDPEWLELQRMLEAPEQEEGTGKKDLYAHATISAAPMTAEEIAAQAREEMSEQKGRREREMEDEKEDAEEKLQAEFEEMDELEERVRKLREKREALRTGSTAMGAEEKEQITKEVMAGVPASNIDGQTNTVVADDDDDDDDDEDLDDWNFGAD